jgi:Fe2+ or Zn2+ uptake regulation protein
MFTVKHTKLSKQQKRILAAVENSDGRVVTPGQLCDAICDKTSPKRPSVSASVARAISRLCDRGLVERVLDESGKVCVRKV